LDGIVDTQAMDTNTLAVQAALTDTTPPNPAWGSAPTKVDQIRAATSMGSIPVPKPTVPDHGLVDQLHSLYAERARLDAAIGLSDADEIIDHVMKLRREQQAIRADVDTAVNILRLVTARLETLS
jgi:hypothetical protein